MNNNSLRNQFIRDMQLKNYAEKTQQADLGHVLRYVKHYKKSPLELGKEQIKQYLHTLVIQKRSQSYISQAYSALKFLYEVTMNREWGSYKIPRGRRERRLPHAFSQKEIIEFFSNIRNPKHRAIFELMYCGGLRVSEVVNLKIKDINSTYMSIFIRGGKGNKDRYTTLSNTALETIRIYYKLYWPKEYLFPGTMKNKPITSRTVQQAFTTILQRTRIQKDLTVHSIRHSFSTHMLENGVDVYHLQKLLGHSNLNSLEF